MTSTRSTRSTRSTSLPTPLGGVIPPVCTPLTPAGDVDTASLLRLVDHLTGAGVDALFVLGTTSEVAFLTDRQRRTVVETVAGHLGGTLPLLAGAIDTTTPRVLQQARAALDAGADAVLATAPFYVRPHRTEIERHYRLLAERLSAPLFAYDLPTAVPARPAAELLVGLAADGVLAGLKDSSGDVTGLRTVIAAVRAHPDPAVHDFTVLTGSENLVDATLLLGADGVVPGLGNVDPHGFVRLVRHCRAGRWARARAEQQRLLALSGMSAAGGAERMGPESALVGAFKAALRLRGVIAHATTAEPQTQLNDAEIRRVAQHLATAGLS